MTRRPVRWGVSLVCTAGLALTPLGVSLSLDPVARPAASVFGPAQVQAQPQYQAQAQPDAHAQAQAPAPAEGAATAPGYPGAPTPQQATDMNLVPNPSPEYLALSIDSVSPQVADGSPGTDAVNGVPIVTVAVTLRNVSAVPLEGISLRLQRGEGTSEPADARRGLVEPESQFSVAGPFEHVAARLEPGEQVQASVSLPLAQVDGKASLGIETPGVYPLLVNANGTPGQGSAARLADARTLLPVLPGALRHLPGRSAVEPTAVDVTMLYPIAAAPTRRATVPGLDGPAPTVHLTEDTLLGELGPGGRLSGLFDALEAAESRNDALREAICLAVDPELLRTVSDIAAGQEVVVDGPEQARRIIDAGAAASSWLDRLRALAAEHCVVPLPPAQADLAAVAATGSAGLSAAVTDGPGLEITRVLGVEPLPNVTVPAGGTISATTLDQLPGLHAHRLVVAANALRTTTGAPAAPGVSTVADGRVALGVEPTVATALAATGSRPENPRFSVPEQRYWLAADSAEARLQDARAALLAPVVAAVADAERAGESAPRPSALPLTVVPPQVWSLDDDGIESFLDTLSAQLTAGTMRAVSLDDALAAAPVTPDPVTVDATDFGATITADTLGQEVPELSGIGASAATAGPDTDPGAVDVATIGKVAEAMRRLGTLRTIVDTEDPSAATADDFLDPLRSEALRALTTTGRRAGGAGSIESLEARFGQSAAPTDGPTTGRAARSASIAATDRLNAALDQAFTEIELLPPGTVYRMASPNSPLLLVARNGLPFPIRVGVRVDTPPGVRVDAAGQVAVPAFGSRTVQLPAETSAADGRRAGITMQLTTAEGAPLSDPVQVAIQSGGSRVALIFTVAALVAAIALVARRVITVRRGRGRHRQEGTS